MDSLTEANSKIRKQEKELEGYRNGSVGARGMVIKLTEKLDSVTEECTRMMEQWWVKGEGALCRDLKKITEAPLVYKLTFHVFHLVSNHSSMAGNHWIGKSRIFGREKVSKTYQTRQHMILTLCFTFQKREWVSREARGGHISRIHDGESHGSSTGVSPSVLLCYRELFDSRNRAAIICFLGAFFQPHDYHDLPGEARGFRGGFNHASTLQRETHKTQGRARPGDREANIRQTRSSTT